MIDEIRARRTAARAVAAAALLWTASAHAQPPAPVGSQPAPDEKPPEEKPPVELKSSDPRPLLPPKPDTLAQPPDTLDFKPLRDGILTGVGVAFWIVEETAFKDELAPDECRWCDREDGGESELNGLDANMRDLVLWDNLDAADTASNVSAYVVGPLVSLGMGALAAGREGRLPEWRENTLVVLEAMVLATVVGKLSKVAFARKRPYGHFRTDQTEPQDPDENESFVSGHSTMGFSLAVAGGTVASIRGYETAPWVWGIGLTAAAATGYFRMAADKHYVTDVLAGAALGGAIGFAVPWFLARRDIPQGEAPPPAPAPTIDLRDGGAVLGVSLAW